MHIRPTKCVAQRTSISGDCSKIYELAFGLKDQLTNHHNYQEMSDMANMISDIAYDMKQAISSLAADESQRPGLEAFKKMFCPDPIYVAPQEGLPKPNYPLPSVASLTVKRADGSVDEDQPRKDLEDVIGCDYEVIEPPPGDLFPPDKKATPQTIEQFLGVYGC